MDFDLEVLFKRTLSEIKQSTSNRVIDTRPYRGDLTKCIPTRGQFNFVHTDLDGKGGFAQIIEDFESFGAYKILLTIAEGPLGNVMFSIK